MNNKFSFLDEFETIAQQKRIPLHATIEITKRCNFKCYYCYNEGHENCSELSTSTWCQIIKEIAQEGVLFLTITGGEPFLRKDIFEIIAFANELHLAVSIISNGFFITKEIATHLKHLSILNLNISLHTTESNSNDKLTCVNGSFDHALQAIRNCRALGISVNIKHTLSSLTYTHLEKMALLAENEGCTLEQDPLVIPSLQEKKSPYCLSHDIESDIIESYNETLLTDSYENSESFECGAARSMFAIQADGTILPCVISPYPLGNICKDTFKQIWYNNPKIDYFCNAPYGTCRECNHKKECSWCAALSLRETKTLDQPTNFLCDKFKN